ncbi:MAG: SUMF1/EgtB/PvdO family nonheme iron enzyme, partial [Verrucomicrobia bacterium]|nr:SUMF1/EgtB/PvdO family nonheme iron enzyme [Verrucomicrobiota bacterium]
MTTRISSHLAACLALAATLLLTAAAHATVFSGVSNQSTLDTRSGQLTLQPGDVPKALADNATTTSTLAASGLVGTIADVIVSLDITHPATGELTVWLVSPLGTRVRLLEAVGGSGANFTGTVLDDTAATAIGSGTPPFTGTFRPAEPLSALAGQIPNGTWTLEIRDGATGNSGTWNSWSLDLNLSAIQPTLFTWASAVAGNWSDATKWTNDQSSGTAPGAAGQADYTLNFNAAGTYTVTNDLNAGFLLNQLNCGGSTVTLAGNSLAFVANGATLPQINQNSASGVTISNPLSLASDLTVGGSGTGAVALAGVISGNCGLTKTSVGSLTLSSSNTYTGRTTVNAGTLALGAAGTILGWTGGLTIAAGAVLDTSAKPSFRIPGMPGGRFYCHVDGAGSGSCGRIHATGLDITSARLLFTIDNPLDDAVYVLADYTSLTGTFVSVAGVPAGYTLDYTTGNQIRLVQQTPPSGYDDWALMFADAQAADLDFNNDGVGNGIAYFMGMNGLASNPGAVDGKIAWPHVGAVTSFEVQVSDNLTAWEVANPMDVDMSDPGLVSYILPSSTMRKFVRLMVTNLNGGIQIDCYTAPVAFGGGLIDYIPVGDPGNAADPATGFGAVSYEYSIAKNETTISQYCGFLNAVAKTDPYNLYSTNMATVTAIAGIARSGVSGSYTYAVVPGSGNKPITHVSWFDAARFCNWLHNGQPTGAQDASTTEDGAYTLNGVISGVSVNKNASAKVWIPSEDEWYKAAYYDPNKSGGGVGGYWQYPTQSDALAGHTVGVAKSANTYDGDYAVYTGSGAGMWGITDVGAYGLNSASAYGTNDQGGNVWEWNDATISGSSRGLRGGTWVGYDSNLTPPYRYDRDPLVESSDIGFRVASVAAPSADIITFGLPGNPAVISGANISLTVPYGTNVTALAPTFTLSPGATCDHDSGTTYDFTNPVHYIVTSSDLLTTKDYIVTVTVAAPLSANANLGNLVLSAGTLSPVFDAATVSYSAKVASTVAGLTVTPTVAAA